MTIDTPSTPSEWGGWIIGIGLIAYALAKWMGRR